MRVISLKNHHYEKVSDHRLPACYQNQKAAIPLGVGYGLAWSDRVHDSFSSDLGEDLRIYLRSGGVHFPTNIQQPVLRVYIEFFTSREREWGKAVFCAVIFPEKTYIDCRYHRSQANRTTAIT